MLYGVPDSDWAVDGRRAFVLEGSGGVIARGADLQAGHSLLGQGPFERQEILE